MGADLIDVTQDQHELLCRLVETARLVEPQSWETFVAVRLGAGGFVVVHPRATSVALPRPGDLDELAALGLIELQRMPSGARIFRLTPAGFATAGR